MSPTIDSTPTAPENELRQHNSLNEDVPNKRDSTSTTPENELRQHNSLNEDVPNKRGSTSTTPENELRQSAIVTGTIRTNASPKVDRKNFANAA